MEVVLTNVPTENLSPVGQNTMYDSKKTLCKSFNIYYFFESSDKQ